MRDRRDGYRKSLARHALNEPEGFYLPGVWSEGWGREAVAQLFRSSREPPDARLIDLIAGKEFRGVRRIPCTLVIRESCGARSRAAGNPTGGI